MDLEKKLILELEKKDFPDLNFLYSGEVLDKASEFLEKFLEQEKKEFKKDLELENNQINFEIFNKESKLSYFWSLLNHLNNVKSGEKIRKIIEDFEPKLTEFSNEVAYSKRYFEMLEYCLKNCDLDVEQTKIISDIVKAYKVRGIALEKEKQDELKKINLKLSELSTKFSNNVLDSEKQFKYFLETQEFLKEFPKSDLEIAKQKAKKENKDGYLFDASASSYTSIMKYCSSSEIRKEFFKAFNSFASSGKYDNRKIVLEIIKLKNKKAKILGYKNYSELSLEFKMADSAKQVLDLLEDLNKKARPKAIKEVEEIKEFFNLKEIFPWDMAYYSRILKEKKYKLDDKKLKEYFEFENTKNALFDTIKKLYGVEMKKLDIKEKYDEHIEIYEVYKDKKFLSYFIGDYFYNENKRSGAWADELRNKFEDKKSVVVNVLNINKQENGPTLLTLGEVTTMFHEFGHAIHSMLSRSKYADLSGFGVEWDFVELPSQLNEKWTSETDTIINVAKHYKSGEPLPEEIINSLEKLKYFGTGNFVLGQSTYAIIDMMFYSGLEFDSVEDLDKKYLEKVNKLSIFKRDKDYKMFASFSHIFAGGYSAGYYSYLWADIIVDEVWEEFKKHGVYNKEIAKKFEQKILGAGSVKKAKEMFKDFKGREVKIDAFLKEKGLV